MITLNYLINSRTGLGHCSRLVAIVEALGRPGPVCKIRVFHHPDTDWYLRRQLDRFDYCERHSLWYESDYNDDVFDPDVTYSSSNRDRFWAENAAVEAQLLDADVYLSDWLGHLGYIRSRLGSMPQRPLFAGLYHSDVWSRPTDTVRIANWKKHTKFIVDSMLDLFFHISPFNPPDPYPFQTPTVPIPLVARHTTMSPEHLKQKIGLNSSEEYALVNVGPFSSPYPYPGLQHLDEILGSLPFGNVVVMSGAPAPIRDIPTTSTGQNILVVPQVDFGPDLVASARMVVTKPGMSIISECIAYGVPLLLLPADRSERYLKIELLRSIMRRDPPIVRNFSQAEIEKGVESALSSANLQSSTFKAVASNGAEVMAACLGILADAAQHNITTVNTDQMLSTAQRAFRTWPGSRAECLT